MTQLLTFKKFIEKYGHICKHSQTAFDGYCMECGKEYVGYTKKCPNLKTAYEEYKRKYATTDAIFIMMTAQQKLRNESI